MVGRSRLWACWIAKRGGMKKAAVAVARHDVRTLASTTQRNVTQEQVTEKQLTGRPQLENCPRQAGSRLRFWRRRFPQASAKPYGATWRRRVSFGSSALLRFAAAG
ncbi:hypothetical protein EFR01_56400 [Sinorhizobium fredii]|nr:hypothetical protein EFR01_56400 [Sinorhizobium fredii]GLS11644.1 hypothetical protein GCM10007864_52760 [Sinorhizobium fredii]